MWRLILKDRVLAVVMVFAVGIATYGIWWGLPNTVEWEPDSSVPMTTLRGAMCGFSGGWIGQHQPLHPMLIATLCAPYFLFLLARGDLDLSAVTRTYPWGLTDPTASLSAVIFTGRLLSAGAFVVLVWVAYQIGLELKGRIVGRAFAILVVTCYPLVFYGHAGNPDMLYICLMGIALWGYLRVLGEPSLDNVAVLASASALSASVKIQALPFFAGMVPMALWVLFASSRQAGTPGIKLPLRQRGLVVAVSGILLFGATFAAANNVIFNGPAFTQWVLGKKTGAEGARARIEDQAAQLHRESFPHRAASNLVAGTSMPVICLALIGIASCASSRPRHAVALALPLAGYGWLFWRVHMDFIRYMLPGILVLLLLAAMGYEWIWQRGSNRRAGTLATSMLGLLLVGYLAARAMAITWLMTHGSFSQVERWFAAHAVRRDASVEVYQQPAYIPRLDQDVTSFAPTEFFAEQRAYIPAEERGPKTWAVPADLLTMEAVERRAPDYLVLRRGGYPDNSLLEAIETGKSQYSRVAEFGGPTQLLRDPLRVNPRFVICQRKGAL